jgi:hypothetical protein
MRTIMMAAAWAGVMGMADGGNVARADDHWLGVNGTLEVGPVLSMGGSVRFEQRAGRTTWLVRGGMMIGAELEGRGFEAGLLHVGVRRYWGAGVAQGPYVSLEAGGTAMRFPRYLDDFNESLGTEWRLAPSASAAVGGKLGPVDLGVALMFPFIGIGAYVGFDFARW